MSWELLEEYKAVITFIEGDKATCTLYNGDDFPVLVVYIPRKDLTVQNVRFDYNSCFKFIIERDSSTEDERITFEQFKTVIPSDEEIEEVQDLTSFDEF
jgi:hypothetical protein